MTGIDFVIDDTGDRKAVLIDLAKHGELWEDFYDTLLAKDRENEPRETLTEVKDHLKSRQPEGLPVRLSNEWSAFCNRGRYRRNLQVRSVEKCLAPDGTVRGFYSDLPLDPTLPYTHSLYPSHDHITYPKRDQEMVVDARVVNDMKVHLTEIEFWRMIEHLYAAGVAKGKIPDGVPRRLEAGWSPGRHYGGDD